MINFDGATKGFDLEELPENDCNCCYYDNATNKLLLIGDKYFENKIVKRKLGDPLSDEIELAIMDNIYAIKKLKYYIGLIRSTEDGGYNQRLDVDYAEENRYDLIGDNPLKQGFNTRITVGPLEIKNKTSIGTKLEKAILDAIKRKDPHPGKTISLQLDSIGADISLTEDISGNKGTVSVSDFTIRYAVTSQKVKRYKAYIANVDKLLEVPVFLYGNPQGEIYDEEIDNWMVWDPVRFAMDRVRDDINAEIKKNGPMLLSDIKTRYMAAFEKAKADIIKEADVISAAAYTTETKDSESNKKEDATIDYEKKGNTDEKKV
jgi:hypothetical protein